MHMPIVSSQSPWLEHEPSAGQSNSICTKIKKMFHILYFSKKYLLEQSDPCLPRSHMHCPVDVSHTPATLHTAPNDFGQVNSKRESLQVQCLNMTKTLLGFQFSCSLVLCQADKMIIIASGLAKT